MKRDHNLDLKVEAELLSLTKTVLRKCEDFVFESKGNNFLVRFIEQHIRLPWKLMRQGAKEFLKPVVKYLAMASVIYSVMLAIFGWERFLSDEVSSITLIALLI